MMLWKRTAGLAVTIALVPLVLGATQCGPSSTPAPTAPQPSTSDAPAAVGSAEAPKPGGLAAADLDGALGGLWQKEGLAPAPVIDDARFLRRVSLDLRGVIPTPEEVEAFAADKAPDKRAKLIDSMLAGERFADHWTNYWDRVLMGRDVREAQVDRAAFRAWVHQKLATNAPWNTLVSELLTASGQNRAGDGDEGKVNGAVNWLIKYRTMPADLSGATSRVFLGVQIQCAQCHDHKTEAWKMTDFQRLTACFMQTRAEAVDRDGKKQVLDVHDLDKVPRPNAKKMPMVADYLKAKPGAIDGTDFSDSPNRRKALAAWMTAPQNPWFAKAIVNRMWGHFMGRGFVDPVDDFRDSNPAVAPELLDRLARDFVAQGYDLRKLMRLITSTEAYQRAPAPRHADKPAEGRVWARYRVQPLGPDELLDSLVAATKIEGLLGRTNTDLDQLRLQMRRQFAFLFDVDEDDDSDNFSGTIPQALLLLNGRLTNAGASSAQGGALSEVLAMNGGDDAKIRSLYLRTLSREPTADEVTRWKAFLDAPREVVVSEPAQPEPAGKVKGKGKKGMGPDPLARVDRKKVGGGDPRKQAYEDMFWVLLNSSEFFFNH